MRLHGKRPSVVAGWLIAGFGVAAVAAAGVLILTGGSTVESGSTSTIAAPVDPDDVYDPVEAGEPLPDGYRRLLDRDQIRPVYEPAFTSPDGVDWPPDSLVIGVAGEEGAKAYPVTHLNQREMVIDSLEGEPILVSW